MVLADDRRIGRTKRALTQALSALVLEHGYESITIGQIATRADVAYSTFFRHYADKRDLLMDMLAQAVNQLNEYMRDTSLSDADGYLIFKHVQEHEMLYRALLRCQSSFDIRAYIRSLIVEDLLNSCCDISLIGFGEPIPPQIAAYHKANGLLGLLEWWLDHDMPYPPAQMAHIYNQLIKQGQPSLRR